MDTFCPDIKGHIDKAILYSNGSVLIQGWAFHVKLGSMKVKLLDVAEYDVQTESRHDVLNYFEKFMDIHPRSLFQDCGFKILIPKADASSFTISCDMASDGEPLIETTIFCVVPSEQIFTLNKHYGSSVVIIDNFYKRPFVVREFALNQEFEESPEYHKGLRTRTQFINNEIKDVFESALNVKIKEWTKYATNGIFQYCTAKDSLVYHTDQQMYAGILFLSPDAPLNTGTTFWKSKKTLLMTASAEQYGSTFSGGHYDSTNFEPVDAIGNVFNRLILFNSQMIHSATRYFGQTKEDSRLFQLFFFDVVN